MEQETSQWKLPDEEWRRILTRVRKDPRLLGDGAYVRVGADPETNVEELHFFATPANHPEGWRYAFQEQISDGGPLGAFVGRAWRDAASGAIEFEVILYAGAQAVSADYAGGAGDMDEMEFEQAVNRALKGVPADRRWLTEEYGRLIWVGAAH
ncbi:hypothetical protein CCAX7_24670 [Capsulimonas corticalis]|uniref:Uncharacterized protein n=1 Tax=Capsulimonas corticalis TaxID=2219043 RepID=A0A402CVG3_9BACT|nr:hypothetical protein [Capsulimonas corticalis]BDI30416.1 hypothetical protein CCAX7_24670 [Capsulimonas corticalis]